MSARAKTRAVKSACAVFLSKSFNRPPIDGSHCNRCVLRNQQDAYFRAAVQLEISIHRLRDERLPIFAGADHPRLPLAGRWTITVREMMDSYARTARG